MATIHIDRILDTCIKKGASDIHLSVGRPPVLRLHGRLRQLETKSLDPEDTVALMKSITPDRNQQELQEEGGTDFGFAFGDAARFRVSIFRQKGNVSIVLRLIPSKFLSFDEIGLPPIIRSLCRRPRGLFLVTGPTGSGKTTTLASMLNYINNEMDRHIVTVEDPIEYYHTHKKSLINQREVGNDVPSFAEALRRVLRSDPDVILVGEMRDLETISNAILAAETGHLVFSTLHTTGCQGTVNRIIDAFPHEQQDQIRVQLSTSLIAILSQALMPRKPSGMVAAYEFLVVTAAISNLIRENKTFRIDSAIQTGKKYGMQLLDDHLWSLFEKGQIEADEMLDKARNAADLQEKLDKAGKLHEAGDAMIQIRGDRGDEGAEGKEKK
ncbi:MAG: type IV pilus twitching motility protein PilT [Planctomycetia bacterium]|jgi:twitching motility protein PilT|nr:type IV pilus twitching motility protein PilT [Planctomycetia bacterium]MCC7313196.1 type IV pilus twitching motility protein PilT [Planctomycetota bacterium]OQZ06454.1 MAG: type IV pili twitching motility protein PilT [Planctomycetes bacterium UTPLA1]